MSLALPDEAKADGDGDGDDEGDSALDSVRDLHYVFGDASKPIHGMTVFFNFKTRSGPGNFVFSDHAMSGAVIVICVDNRFKILENAVLFFR